MLNHHDFKYSNAKSRYRGEVKHQMWANIRCLWVNFIRILKYIKQLCQRTLFFAKYVIKAIFSKSYIAVKAFLTAILPSNPVKFRKYPILHQLRKIGLSDWTQSFNFASTILLLMNFFNLYFSLFSSLLVLKLISYFVK